MPEWTLPQKGNFVFLNFKEVRNNEKSSNYSIGTRQSRHYRKSLHFLSEANVNILDISQTIVGGYFDMVMVVDITEMTQDFDKVADGLASIGEEMGLVIKMQHTEIFDAMHRI